MPFVTVLTPTYNRSHTLHRLYESLCKQSFKDFDWVVIDDGSTDDTKALIQSYQQEAEFPIHYYYKPNGGKHTALNFALDKIDSPYVHIMDSDDALTDNALQLIKNNWDAIPPEEYERFWCVSGLCLDNQTGKIVGKPWPEGINKLIGRAQHKVIVKYPGDKSCCRKLSVLKEYPFPTFPDVKFVSEGMVWSKINQKYDQYCTNDVFRIYYTDSSDSLAAGKMHSKTRWRTYYYSSMFYVNECFDQIMYNPKIIRSIISLARCSLLSRTPYAETMKGLNRWYKRLLVSASYPVAWIIIKIQRIPY